MNRGLIAILAGCQFLGACQMDHGGDAVPPRGNPSSGKSDIGGSLIYGVDNRLDLYQVTSSSQRGLADSTVALLKSSSIQAVSSATSQLQGEEFGTAYNLCSNEPFRTQPTAAFCSGSLVGSDIIITAGHCITNASDCADTRFVFGFALKQENSNPSLVSTQEIYSCKEIIARKQEAAGADFSVIRLDRSVVGHRPLQLRRSGVPQVNDPLVVMGHPVGLPLKVAGGAHVRTVVGDTHLVANLDTYGGNSGSAVFNENTGLVEGILVRGDQDFVSQGSCTSSNICADDGCRGEDVTLIANVLAYVPDVGSTGGGGSGTGGNGGDTNPPPPPPPPPSTTELRVSATPNLVIPDKNTKGIQSVVSANEATGSRKVEVTINIQHTWIGDLVVTLVAPDGQTRILQNRQGKSAHNIVGTYGEDLTAYQSLSDLTVNQAGTWTLKVSDRASQDVGTLVDWTLIFK